MHRSGPRSLATLLVVALCAGAAACDSSNPAAPATTPQPQPAATLSGLTLGSASVAGGGSVTGTVTLSTAASTGGFAVALASSNTAAATLPASLTVAAGATTGTFTIAGSDEITLPTSITITATAGDVTRTATLQITPAAGVGPIASIVAAHDDVFGGEDTTATVTLTAKAPAGGVGFSLSSDDDRVTVPGSLVIPAGQTSGTFEIDTAPVTSIVEAHITITTGVGLAPRGAGGGAHDIATALASATLTIIVMPEPDDTTPDPPPNAAPTIAAIADQTIDEDTNTGALAFTIADAETDAASLTVTGASSNTGLVPLANIVFGGSDGNRTVTIAPAKDWSGTTTIDVTVSDGETTTTASFTLTVTQLFEDAMTFAYNGTDGSNGSEQEFLIPDGITAIEIEAAGAAGGSGAPIGLRPGGSGANGGTVTATLALATFGLSSGDTLQVRVGGRGGTAVAEASGAAGFNGGAASPDATSEGFSGGGGGGGGASDVRGAPNELADRLVVAGGGGGGGGAGPNNAGYNGGAGGGTTAAAGAGLSVGVPSGAGGTPSAGGAGGDGAGGLDGNPGSSGSGGAGFGGSGGSGGSGGGGWFGGGGGGRENSGQGVGGGGGSSFTATGATNVSHAPGNRSGHGQVIIRW